MKAKLFSILFLSCLSLYIGCTEAVELQSDGMEPALVISGTLSTNPGYQYITIAQTGRYFDLELPYDIDATEVRINGERLSHDGIGTYGLGDYFAAVEGKRYDLEVWIDFDQDGTDEYYTATTTVPYHRDLSALSLEPVLPSSKPNIPFLLVAGIDDQLGEDFYGASLFINDELYSNRILRYSILTLDITAEDGQLLRYPLSDWIIYKSLTWDNGATFDLYCGDVLTVELQTLSKEYFQYLTDAKTEKSQQFPLFSGPRGNVEGNIEGALGVFGSYASSRYSVTIPDCDGLPKREVL